MTEAEWLACDDPEAMIREILVPGAGPIRPGQPREGLDLPRSRALDLFCVACYRVIEHLVPDDDAKQAMEWLEANAGRVARGSELEEELDRHGHNVKDAFEYEGYTDLRHVAARVTGYLWCGDLDMPLHWFREGFEQEYPGVLPRHTVAQLAGALRDLYGNPFRPVRFCPEWRTDTAVSIARTMYDSRDFNAMPILADALQDAGCDNDDILDHCRDATATHVRGCWVVDLVLGKE